MIQTIFANKHMIFEIINISDRCIVMKMPVKKNRGKNSCNANLWIVNLYAPTECATDEDKQAFYDMIEDKVWNRIPKHDYTICLGDMNAMTGKRKDDLDEAEILGNFDMNVRNDNDNGDRLIHMCRRQKLRIVNTCFRKPRGQATWKFQGKCNESTNVWRRLDYIMVDNSEMRKVQDCEVVPLRDTLMTDHNLVLCRMRITCTLERYQKKTLQ